MTAPDDAGVHEDAGEGEEEDEIDASGIDFDEDGNVVGVKTSEEEMSGETHESAAAAAGASATATTGVKRHPRASVYGGITSPDSANESNMKGVVVGLVKEAGKMLFSGQVNLLQVSLPVSLFEPRSYLEKMADTWFYPHFFDLAYAHYKQKNPEEGIKWLVTFGVAGVHRAFDALQKPFSPILGETFQATYEYNAAEVNLEQISHHPPVSAFSVKSINDKGEGWHYFGCSEPLPSFKGNSIKTFGYGIRKVIFYIDGNATEIFINFPDFHIVNLMMGQLRGDVRGEVKVIDRANMLMANVTYGPNKITVNGKKNVKVNDAVVGEIEKFDSRDDMPFGDEVQKKKKPHNYKTAAPSSSSSSSSTTAGSTGAEPEKAHPSGGIGSGFRSYFAKRTTTPPSPKASAPSAGASPDDKPKRKTGFGLGLRAAARGAVSARTAPSTTILSRFEGSWVSHLDVDNVRYWTMFPESPIMPDQVAFDTSIKPDVVANVSSDSLHPVKQTHVLPSDVRFRDDVNALKTGDMDASQRSKVVLEELQRHDAKERMAGGGVDV